MIKFLKEKNLKITNDEARILRTQVWQNQDAGVSSNVMPLTIIKFKFFTHYLAIYTLRVREILASPIIRYF